MRDRAIGAAPLGSAHACAVVAIAVARTIVRARLQHAIVPGETFGALAPQIDAPTVGVAVIRARSDGAIGAEETWPTIAEASVAITVVGTIVGANPQRTIEPNEPLLAHAREGLVA